MPSNHRTHSLVSLFGIAIVGTVSFVPPAQALLWTIEPGTQTDNGLSISGSFSIDNELAATPMMLASAVSIDGNVFDASEAKLDYISGMGVSAIDWLDASSNRLSFVFATPLTPAGGKVMMDNIVSTYTPFTPSVSSLPDFVSGSVSGVPGPLPVLGAGAALAWSRKLKRRINNSRASQS